MPKVLVADDNPLTLRAVQLSLELAGFEVVATGEPGKVVELSESEGVDAAVLDVVMPDMTGYDVLRALRANPATAAVPVIFLSGLGDGPDRVRGLREGADDYLVKPFEPAELAMKLERLIAHGREGRGGAAPPTTGEATDSQLDLSRLEEHVREGRRLRGVSLGRYEVQAVLGEGATGTVFRGWDTRLQRPVALKTIRLSRAAVTSQRGELRSGLLREAVTAARFHHPNIIAIYDLEETREIAFIIMEFVNGMNLAAYLAAGGALGWRGTLPIAAAVASALTTAHEHRVVHHDLKPANVLLGRNGAIKVSDFGIAMFVSSMLRGDAQVFGTPGYIPPECLAGEPYDERGDLFALGVTLYTCIVGSPPFAGATLQEIVTNTIEKTPASPRRVDRECPVELDGLVMSLLAKERRRRLASAAQAARQLELLRDRERAVWAPSMAVMESAAGAAHAGPRSTLVATLTPPANS